MHTNYGPILSVLVFTTATPTESRTRPFYAEILIFFETLQPSPVPSFNLLLTS